MTSTPKHNKNPAKTNEKFNPKIGDYYIIVDVPKGQRKRVSYLAKIEEISLPEEDSEQEFLVQFMRPVSQ